MNEKIVNKLLNRIAVLELENAQMQVKIEELSNKKTSDNEVPYNC